MDETQKLIAQDPISTQMVEALSQSEVEKSDLVSENGDVVETFTQTEADINP